MLWFREITGLGAGCEKYNSGSNCSIIEPGGDVNAMKLEDSLGKAINSSTPVLT